MTECWCGGDLPGYGKHIKRVKRTEPCPESRKANAAYQRSYKERHREKIKEYNRTHVVGWYPGTDVDLTDDAL